MTWTAAPVGALAVLIGIAGAAKVARPRATAQALRDARIPGLRGASDAHATALGAMEVALAAAALVWGNNFTTAAVATAQIGFAAFALRLLAVRGGAGSCGCFGSNSSPVHPVHVALNGALALVALTALTSPPGPISSAFDAGAATTVATVVTIATLVWSLVLAFTSLPELLIAAEQVRDDGATA